MSTEFVIEFEPGVYMADDTNGTPLAEGTMDFDSARKFATRREAVIVLQKARKKTNIASPKIISVGSDDV